MKDPNAIGIKTISLALGDEFAQADFVFGNNKRAKVIVPIDSASDPSTYLINSQDVMANITLAKLTRNMLLGVAESVEEKPGVKADA